MSDDGRILALLAAAGLVVASRFTDRGSAGVVRRRSAPREPEIEASLEALRVYRLEFERLREAERKKIKRIQERS